MRDRGAPLPLGWTLWWSAVVTLAYAWGVLDWGGLLGGLFAAPPLVLMIVIASILFVVRRVRGAVSLRAWVLVVLIATVASVLLLALSMSGGGDPYGELLGLWSKVMLPLAALHAATAFVVHGVIRKRMGSDNRG